MAVDYTKDNQHLPEHQNTADEPPKEAKTSLSALFASRQPDHNLEDMEYDKLYFSDDLKHVRIIQIF